MPRRSSSASLPQGLSTSGPNNGNRWWNRPSASAAHGTSIHRAMSGRSIARGIARMRLRFAISCFAWPRRTSAISVYLVASATDLARVAIALNANRSSKTEPLFLLAITAAELAKITIRRTPGLTLCRWANHLHRDLLVADLTSGGTARRNLGGCGRKQQKFTGPCKRRGRHNPRWLPRGRPKFGGLRVRGRASQIAIPLVAPATWPDACVRFSLVGKLGS